MATTVIGNVKGATGATPNLRIGTVQTLVAGASATATIRGTPENPVLDLGLPKGDKGNTGATGEVTTTALNNAIATSEAKIRPVSAGGTGHNVANYDISTMFRKDSNLITADAINLQYFPYEKRCYLRMGFKTNATFNANTEYTIGSVDSYVPSATHVMNVRCYSPVNYVSIGSNGDIVIKTAAAQIPTNYTLYITGWWFYGL